MGAGSGIVRPNLPKRGRLIAGPVKKSITGNGGMVKLVCPQSIFVAVSLYGRLLTIGLGLAPKEMAQGS